MKNNNELYLFLLISLCLFLPKWILSYYFYSETTSVKVIFESITDGFHYFPLVKYLAIFEFNNSFNPSIENLDNVMLPFYSVAIPAFFYKFVESISFILIEYLSIFFYIYLLFKILNFLYSKEISLVYSLIIFLIPLVLSYFSFGDLTYIKIIKDDIFSLRFPRPLISSLLLFFYIYFIISLEKKEFFTNKNFFILAITLGVTLSSFYYFFFFQISTLMIYVIYRYKNLMFSNFLRHWKMIIIFLVTFLIVISPMVININTSENDYAQRLGIITLNFDQKKILIMHYIKAYVRIDFLIILFSVSLFIFTINHKKIFNYKIINLFYLFFLGSLFSPLLFILITNKSGILYHFNNTVIIFIFLLILLIIYEFINFFFKKNFNKKILNTIAILTLGCCMVINIYNELPNDEDKFTLERNEFNEVSKLITKNYELNKTSILTFDDRFMVWSVLNNIKYLNLTYFIMTPKKDDMIEDDIIKSLKFLGKDLDNFKAFIANRKSSWRYINYNLSDFLFYKYMANPIKTFNDSENFDNNVKDFIKNTSPINFQQTIIPNDELKRLEDKFVSTNLDNFNFPDIIILNLKNKFLENITYIDDYCIFYKKEFFVMFVKKNSIEKCN